MTESLYVNLTKSGDSDPTIPDTPQESGMLVDRDPNSLTEKEREELSEDERVEWQNLKKRWDNIGIGYEILNQCAQVLNEEESLFGIQQLDNAKNHIANAKAELEKAFKFECNQIAHETKTPCMIETPWATNVKSEPRKSKDDSESEDNKKKDVEKE